MKRTAGILLIVLLALGMAGIQTAPVHAATALTVSTCDESHLDSAVTQANSDNAGDVITFACSGDITLTSKLSITGSMTMDGSGQNVTLDGQNQVQVFTVLGAHFTLKALTIAHGVAACCGPGGVTTGGGMYNNGSVIITNSSFIDDTAPLVYGGCGGGSGGGLYNDGGTVTITNSTFSGNSANYDDCFGTGGAGGGLTDANGGTVSISGSTFSGNSSSARITAGSGLANGDFDSGVFGGTVTITNSTFTGNFATNGGGGGAISNDGTLTITNSTLSGNSTAYGTGAGAIFNEVGTVKVGGSIIAYNTESCGNNGTITDLGYNLDTDGSWSSCLNGGTGDISGQDPKLDPNGLHNNGGPTQTMALQPTSPAIDKIPAGTLNCVAGGTDQRGQSRPDAGESSCDMGAYEYQEPLVLVLAVSPTTVQRGSPVTASVTLGNPTTSSQTVTGTVTLVYSGSSTMKLTLPYTLTLAAGQTLAKTVTFTVPPSFPTGTYTVTATAADSAGTATSTASLTVT